MGVGCVRFPEDEMHEYALADAVVRAVLEASASAGLDRVLSFVVRIGELQRIQPEVFDLALQEVRRDRDARLDGATATIEIEPALFHCRPCGRDFPLAEAVGGRDGEEQEAIHFLPELAHAFLRCPVCASPDFEVRGGRGVEVASIEGERHDA